MSIEPFYLNIRQEFPDIIKSADEDFINRYGEDDGFDSETPFLWFESLANSINHDMHNEVSPNKYKVLFEWVRKAYLFEGDDVKKCIDVAFIENLFWQVPKEKAKIYWQVLPEILKDLYVSFHHKTPV